MKKKICFVVSSPFTAKAFLVNHIITLSIIYDVYLVANFEKDEQSVFNNVPLIGIKNINIPRDISLIRDFKALVSLRTYFKEMQFDAVHTVTPKAGLLGILASRLAGIKKRIHIFTGQVWHTRTGIFKKLLMFLDRFIVWNATDILVDGESQRQFLIKNNIVKDSNSFVLGKGSISGVDTYRFVPNEAVKIAVRAELGIAQNDVVYMFLGRMNRDKGINELAEAFNELRQNYSNVRLLLVGGDEENMTPIVQQKVVEINSVIFYGVTPKPERLLQACDVFCLPSYREGFGTSVIEASLLEKPIICSNTYGLMETIIEGKTGLRHNVADVRSLYEKMEILVANQELRNLLGKEGRAYVLENFSAQVISNKWLEFYKNKV
jgi:glycosyltransferase involved in cell wall biosynthesis